MFFRRLPGPLLCTATGLCLVACVQPNLTGTPSGDGDAGGRELQPTASGGDGGSEAAPDGALSSCSPPQLGCTPDRTAIAACNERGEWMATTTCPSGTTCSAGSCLCPGDCAESPPLAEVEAGGLVEDLAGGAGALYLAANGSNASIRRFDLPGGAAVVARRGEPDFTRFALDAGPEGNLLWCSEIIAGSTRTGQVVYGAQQLETGACTHVRRRDNLVYFKGDFLYRKPLDAGSRRELVSTEPMRRFEIAGDHLYFVGEEVRAGVTEAAFLKRFPLGAPDRVETLGRRPETTFLTLLPDAEHVYLVSDGGILRLAHALGSALQPFWVEPGLDAWALVQTDTHLYWTATLDPEGGCLEAQVLRQPKTGGPVTRLARVTGACAGQIVRVADHLYAVVVRGSPPSGRAQILRVRL